MVEVTIGTVGGTYVRLRDAERQPWGDEGFGSFVAELHGAGLDAFNAVLVHPASGPGLDTFFAELADSWRGWEGSRRWSSIELDLVVGARQDPLGHNVLTFTLNCGTPPTWTATVDLQVDAGEETKALAAELARLMDETR